MYILKLIFICAALFFTIYISLIILNQFEKNTGLKKTYLKGFIYLVCFIALAYTLKTIVSNILHPHQWDFFVFYMNGKVAVNGANFYQNSEYLRLLKDIKLPFIPSEEIQNDLFFHYFPANIFYFLPFGFFSFKIANILWSIFNLAFISFDIILIYKLFFKNEKSIYFFFVILAFLLLPTTHNAVYYEQTTFIFLLFILLMWKDLDKPISGLWLTLGIFAKPILAIFLIYPVLRRKWKMLLTAALAFIFISGITLIIFGPSVFITFFFHNPNVNIPRINYTEWTNQSLLSTIIRITNYDFSYSTPLIHPLFVISALLVCGFSFWFIYKLDDSRNEWAFAIIILTSIMLYPGSINSYGPMIIPVLLFLFMQRNNFSAKGSWLIVIIAAAYAVNYLDPFLSYLFIWSVLLFIVSCEKKHGNKFQFTG